MSKRVWKACVADDDPNVLRSVIRILSAHDYEVSEFDSGDELLEHLCTHPDTDLVVTDLHMSGEKDGLDVVRGVRLNPFLYFIPVIVHTADGDAEAKIQREGGLYAAKGGKPSIGEVLNGLSHKAG